MSLSDTRQESRGVSSSRSAVFGMSMTAWPSDRTHLWNGTSRRSDPCHTTLDLDVAPGLYASLVACLALLALMRWPETAFKPTI